MEKFRFRKFRIRENMWWTNYRLESILNHNIKPLQESWPFQKPVNKKQLKHYYEKIKEPMDLETMGKKVQQHAYHSRSEFFRDMELIWSNSKDFNGEQSEFTSKAKLLVDITKEKMYQAYNDDMARLVNNRAENCDFCLFSVPHLRNNRFLRERGMASTPKKEYQFFFAFSKRTQLWVP